MREMTADFEGQKLADPVWRDSVVVPRNGRVTVRSRFLDYTGRFVLHCHMMNRKRQRVTAYRRGHACGMVLRV